MLYPDLFNLYYSQGHEALISAIGEATAAEFLADPETQAALATHAYFQRYSDLMMARRRREVFLNTLEQNLKAATTPAERYDAAWALLRASQAPLLPTESGPAVPAVSGHRAADRGPARSVSWCAPTFRLPSLAPRLPNLAPIVTPMAHRNAPTEASVSTEDPVRPASNASSHPDRRKAALTPPVRLGIFDDDEETHAPAPARRTPGRSRVFPATGLQHLVSPGLKGRQSVATRVSGWWPRSSAKPQRGDSGRGEPALPAGFAARINAPTPRARDRP